MIYYSTYKRLNLHVNASTRDVLRALYRKLKPAAFTYDQKVHRHAIAKDILYQHLKAKELFNNVMHRGLL